MRWPSTLPLGPQLLTACTGTGMHRGSQQLFSTWTGAEHHAWYGSACLLNSLAWTYKDMNWAAATGSIQ